MKDLTKKWWFWAIVAVVGVIIYLNHEGKQVALVAKPGKIEGTPTTDVTPA